jgi:NAD(P)-dependent dehydrogenase (short-subunit alcohol dehydrogenase family)
MSSIPPPKPLALATGLALKTVIITGAASGIGFATAQLFAKHGGKVVLVDLSEPRLRAAAMEVGHGAVFYACDVSSWTAQVGLFEWVRREIGVPEIVCLNAGVDPELATAGHAATADTARGQVLCNFLADEYVEAPRSDVLGGQVPNGSSRVLRRPSDLVIDVNLKGVIYGLKLAVHYLLTISPLQARGGRIIITGSAASYVPFANQDIYLSSKHAVLGLMRSTSRRMELIEKGVCVAMVAPWLTTTAMTADLAEATEGSEMSTPEDVAMGIAYLATEPREDAVQGRCLWTKGKRLIEVEGAYENWLGQLMKS